MNSSVSFVTLVKDFSSISLPTLVNSWKTLVLIRPVQLSIWKATVWSVMTRNSIMFFLRNVSKSDNQFQIVLYKVLITLAFNVSRTSTSYKVTFWDPTEFVLQSILIFQTVEDTEMLFSAPNASPLT
jgi:hypothetical protein